MKGSNGKYLTRCTNCWNQARYPDAAFVNGETPDGSSLWTPEYLGKGKWGLKGDNCKYLARCNGCATGSSYSSTAFVYADNPNDSSAQWTVLY